MKIKNLAALSVACLTLLCAACGNTVTTTANNANTPAGNSSAAAANKSNTAVVSNADQPAANKTAPASSPKSSDISSVDFLNYSYQSPSCAEDLGISKTVKVSKGKFKDGDNYYNVKDNNFMYADVNGDGREDAVVTIECGNSAGTFRSFEIHAFTLEKGQAKILATLDNNQVTEDYAKHFPDSFVFGIPQNGVTIDKGSLVADVMTDGSFAMPKNISTFIYKLSGDKFTLTAKPKKRSYKP